MNSKKSSNVFISHYGKDDAKVQRLKQRFAEKNYSIRNYSVDSTKHTQNKKPSNAVIERFLRRQISWSGTFICLIGPKTHTRKWVNYEIEEAHRQGKKIVGVYTHGNNNCPDLPKAFQKYGGPLIGWNSTDKLIDIVQEKEFPKEMPSGIPSAPLYGFPSITC